MSRTDLSTLFLLAEAVEEIETNLGAKKSPHGLARVGLERHAA